MHNCIYWIWLSLKFQPGNTAFDKIFRTFGYDIKAIYNADENSFSEIFGKNSTSVTALSNKTLDNALKIFDFCRKNDVGILTPENINYPSQLLRIQGQPPVLYYKGTVPDFSASLSIAVVGTRNVTSYGSSAAYTISHDLAYAGSIIVSGMALGTDTAAHRGALDAKGKTVAFLGSGINVIYPKQNTRLFEEISEHGAVITEYPPFSRPEGRHFPIRNRLISGVSHGVLVVEAARKSGALLTADHAIKQGKLLYALPGRIGELTSEGTNNLLLSGAKAVTKTEDIISDFSHIFTFRAIPNSSGFTQFTNDCSFGYPSSFNPFSHGTGSQTSYSGKGSFFDRFRPLPTERYPHEESSNNHKAKDNINSENALPRYYDPSSEKSHRSTDVLGEPKPVIVYSDFDDEEFSKANKALSKQQKDELETLDMLSHRPVIRYSGKPIPKGGYKVRLTKEKAEEFDRLTEEMNSRRVSPEDIKNGIKVHSPFKGVSDLKELDRLYMEDKLRHEKRQAENQTRKTEKVDMYKGLTSIEISVLKLLESGEKLTVDSMSGLGIPLPKLLSVLTVLEIKKRVVQLPGGYFQINKDGN